MPNPHHRPAIPAGLAAIRLHNTDAFLATRGLDRDSLGRLLRSKAGDARHLLLTSSPVHGLANATSDLDFIRIQAETLGGARMAAQLFDGGHHMETVSFDSQEAADALAELDILAGEEPARVIQGHRAWDKSHELRRKYLERLVNGVEMDGTSPYLQHLPALARVWKWSSLHAALEQVFFLQLAEGAGESHGRVGYALSALLHLMDATLSQHGDVFCNRKWYLLRWRRLLSSGALDGTPSAALAEPIEHLRHRVSAVLAGNAAEPLAPPFTELLNRAFDIAGEGRRPALSLETAGAAQRLRFLPGAELLLGDAAIFLRTGALPSGTLEIVPGAGLPGDPGDVLRAARGGALRLLPA